MCESEESPANNAALLHNSYVPANDNMRCHQIDMISVILFCLLLRTHTDKPRRFLVLAFEYKKSGMKNLFKLAKLPIVITRRI